MGYIDQHRYQKSPNRQNENSQNQWQHRQQQDEGHPVVGCDSHQEAALVERYLEQRIAKTDQADPILPSLKGILVRLRAIEQYKRENASYQGQVDAILSNPRWL